MRSILGQIIKRNGIYQFVAGQYQLSTTGEWVFVEGFNDNGVFIEGTWHNGFFSASEVVDFGVLPMADRDDGIIDDEPAEDKKVDDQDKD